MQTERKAKTEDSDDKGRGKMNSTLTFSFFAASMAIAYVVECVRVLVITMDTIMQRLIEAFAVLTEAL